MVVVDKEWSGEKRIKGRGGESAGHDELAGLGGGSRPAVAEQGVIPEPLPSKDLDFV